jgi:xylan 1,4-beta-xylosidase
MVARRLQHHRAEATVEMEFDPKNFQQCAGLSVFYDTYNFFYLHMSYEDEGKNVLRIIIRNNFKFIDPLMCGVDIGEAKKVWLRVRIDNCNLQFYYSLNGVDFEKIGEELDCSNLADEAYCDIDHEGHTGTFIAMCCQDLSTGENENRCHADFNSFSYKEI